MLLTGMLETVRIRRAGYNIRVTFDEFIQQYRILLPRGLLSSRKDIQNVFLTFGLNRENYQLGEQHCVGLFTVLVQLVPSLLVTEQY